MDAYYNFRQDCSDNESERCSYGANNSDLVFTVQTMWLMSFKNDKSMGKCSNSVFFPHEIPEEPLFSISSHLVFDQLEDFPESIYFFMA